jgi:hypothetical protein
MGLLDDAIRDHLELKRRRGADPGEVAHEERAALDPVFPAEQPLAKETVSPEDDVPDAGHGETWEEPLTDEEAQPASAPSQHAGAENVLPAGEETAELDMQAVLDADGHEPAAAVEGGPGGRLAEENLPREGRRQDFGAGDADSFEWEMPGERSERAPEPGPGQERMSFE